MGRTAKVARRQEKPLSAIQSDALCLLDHPAEYGRRLGFTLLKDRLHDRWIRKIICGDGDMTLQAHRGSYKTTCLAVALTELLLIERRKNIIFLRKTDNDVNEVLESVRRMLLHPLTQAMANALTGKPLELWRSTKKQITTAGYVKTGGTPQLLGIGIGSSLTGKHADIIITDDIVNTLDRESRAEREKTKKTYEELQNVRNPGGRIINTGTPWHKDDAFTLMPKPERWDCYSTGLLSNAEIEGLRQKMSPSLFAANYELRHIAAEGALFTSVPPRTEDESVLANGIAHIDAAYDGEDYTALTLAQKRDGKIYLYGRIWRQHVDTVLRDCLAESARLRCGPIHCEKNSDKGYLAREIKARGGYAFTYTEKENKYVKIATFLRKWWPNIVFVSGTDPEYISQILDYTDTAAHDDAPDSAACCCRILDRR